VRYSHLCERLENELTDLNHSAFLEITYHANNIYLHEIALYPDHNAEDFRPPFFISVKLPSARRQNALTPPYINALIQCASSAEAVITIFLNMSVKQVLQCPTLVYVRVVYATVILIKLSISANLPSSELGRILEPANNKTEAYLKELLSHLGAVATLANGDTHVLSSKFLGILTKLKQWCQHQKRHRSEGARFSREPERENGQIATVTTLTQGDVAPQNGPSLGYEPVLGTSYSEAPARYNAPSSLHEPPSAEVGARFGSFGTSPTIGAMDQRGTQPLHAIPWPVNDPASMAYSESLSMPLDFPMGSDPDLFTHLINAELNQGYQDNWTPDGASFSAMDSSILPEYSWATWPQQKWP